MEKLGNCSWAEILNAGLHLRLEFTPDGWTYSVYDLASKTCLLLPQPAATEEQAQHLAERWAIGAGLMCKFTGSNGSVARAITYC
jgi:hypothetical protein